MGNNNLKKTKAYVNNIKQCIKKTLIIILSFCLTANTALANTYKETQREIFFRSWDNFLPRIYETFYDKNNKLYSLYGNSDIHYLIQWDEDKTILKELKMPKSILKQIIKHQPQIKYNRIMPGGNMGMQYECFLSDDKTKKLFAIVSPDGKLVSKIDLAKMFNISYSTNTDTYYKVHNYKNNRIFVQLTINRHNKNDINMAGVIDYKKKKLLWKRKVSDNEGFFQRNLLDLGKTAKNKYMIGFNKSMDKFVISGIKTGKIIKELDLNAVKEKATAFEYKNNSIYIAKKDGVYKLKWNEDKMTKLIDLQNHWINKGKHYAADITVVNDNEFYVTGYDPGKSEQTILFKFKK